MMATGYVHLVADGEITTVREFALKCSYAMMPMVALRDDDHRKEPPRELPLDLTYYEERLVEAQTRLDSLAMMTDAEREATVEAEYQEELKRAREYDAQADIEYDRVKAMRAKVEAWEGGPEGLKAFMLSQIQTSLGRTDAPYRAVDHVTRRDPDDAWRRAVKDVGEMHGNIEREKALHKSRNAWLAQLWTSLPAE